MYNENKEENHFHSNIELFLLLNTILIFLTHYFQFLSIFPK